MKRHKVLIITVCVLALIVTIFLLFVDRIIAFAARQQLEKTFPGSVVEIGKIDLDIRRSLTFSNIEIKRRDLYDFKIKKVEVNYSIPSLITGNINSFSISEPSIVIVSSRKNASELTDLVNLSTRSIFRIKDGAISEAGLRIKTRDLNLTGTLSIEFPLETGKAGYIDSVIGKFEARGLLLEGVYIKGDLGGEGADIFIKKIKYSDAVMNDARGKARLERQFLLLDSLAAQLFNGEIEGSFKVGVGEDGEFSMDLTCANLNLGSFIKDFKLGERLELTGMLNGALSVSGERLKLTNIRGDFSTDESGGTLIIKDINFLENMAKESGQSIDIVMENFKNYKYTIGIIKVSLDSGSILLDVAMDGDTGKRMFNIVLHDIFTK